MKQFSITQHGWGLVIEPAAQAAARGQTHTQFITAQADSRYKDIEHIEYISDGRVRTTTKVNRHRAPETIISLMRGSIK